MRLRGLELKNLKACSENPFVRFEDFFLWIGFWLSRHQFLQGVRFFGTNQAM
jgi:hypothetical protein